MRLDLYGACFVKCDAEHKPVSMWQCNRYKCDECGTSVLGEFESEPVALCNDPHFAEVIAIKRQHCVIVFEEKCKR